MEKTPESTVFDSAYLKNTAPWVIGEPQPVVVEVEKEGWFKGKILDIGCGTGEHTIFLKSSGHDILGMDASKAAIDQARANAARRGVEAQFAVGNALDTNSGQYDTILDSALFHIFDTADRGTYVENLHAVCRSAGTVIVLALSDEGPGFGPEISESDIRSAFGTGWQIETLRKSRYVAVATAQHHVTNLGLKFGERVELPAWLARIRRL